MSRAAARTRRRRAAHAAERQNFAAATAVAEPDAPEVEAEEATVEHERDPRLAAALEAVADHAAAVADDVVPPELAPQERVPETNPSPSAPPEELAAGVRWQATFAPEGKPTDDGRMFWPGSISWRELPLSLMAMVETSEGGHIGAELAGRIERIWRDEEEGMIRAEGIFDPGEYGTEIARLVGDETLRGLSIDIAARAFQIVPKERLFDEDGQLREDALDEPEDQEEPDLLDILFGETEEVVFVVTDGVIGMATVCPFPAFEDASISLAASGMVWRFNLDGAVRILGAEEDELLTASAAGLAPIHPPAAWFEPPELTELTPLTVTDEGEVYGHAAAWGTCHIGIPDGCTTPPHSGTGYAYFLLGEVETAEGDTVATGRITLDTNHADRRLGRRAAAAHYDNTGAVVADVVAGEDEHGIWVAGALRPDVPAARVRKFRGSVLSGDWRSVNGGLELVALLACNVPGFPIPRTRALVAAGEDGGVEFLTLVAAGLNDGVAEVAAIDEGRLRVLATRAHEGLDGLADLAHGLEKAAVAPHAYEEDDTGHCAECGMTEADGNHTSG